MGRTFVLGCDSVFDWNGSSDISYENPFNCGSNDIEKNSVEKNRFEIFHCWSNFELMWCESVGFQ